MDKLTITPSDGAIYVDGQGLLGFDLSMIPEGVHALHWDNAGSLGVIERLGMADEYINEAPDWALNCVSMWETKWDEMNQPPTIPDPTIPDFVKALQFHLDTVAKQKNYDGSLSIVSYLSSTNPQWVNEANTFVAWRDQCWLYGYQELAKFENGERPIVSIDAFIQELPVITWP